MSNITQLGKYLRAAREAKGMRQTDLAANAGVSSAHIHSVESGKIRGSYQVLLKIANCLDLPVDLVLKKAGFPIPEQTNNPPMQLEDHELIKLSPKLKQVILELVPILRKHIGKS